jgi:hypothetical protein
MQAVPITVRIPRSDTGLSQLAIASYTIRAPPATAVIF